MNQPVITEQDFEEIFREHFGRLTWYIRHRLNPGHEHMAEDLAQDTLISLWTDFVQKDRLQDVPRVFALLSVMARYAIAGYYKAKSRAYSTAVDFSDPANTRILATGHSYGYGTPTIAGLVQELDSAMSHMSSCSQKWRDLHKERYALRGYLADGYLDSRGGLTGNAKARTAKRLASADQEEAAALDVFRSACQRVGNLRAEIESEAGADWRSVAGFPRAKETPTQKGVFRNDLSITHCPEGHLLETDNVHFLEDGSRKCRACRAAQNATYARSRNATSHAFRPTTDEATIAAARAMYLDPDNSLTVAAIAREVGVSAATLYRRIPELAARRTGINPCTRKSPTERTNP